ncbi:MAG: alanine--glyoxylate aminotransferase family protein [Candidatus Bathyarchaeota archaeon]
MGVVRLTKIKKMTLLNVGPVMISDTVRNTMLNPDLCHRENEFTEILCRVRKTLTEVFKGNDEFATVIINGSGTAAIEATISSMVRNGKLLILSNGYYGEKIAKIARIYNINTEILKLEWGERIRTTDVETYLASDPDIQYVAMVHNETSTGMLNNVNEIGNLVSKNGKTFIVDAISSVGVEDLDVVRDKIDFCIGSPNKCIESIPGISFVCARKRKLQEIKGLPPKTSYLDLYNYFIYEEGTGERLGTPFTPPVQVFYALEMALNLLIEESIEKRRERYSYLAKLIRDELEKLGFRLFLQPKVLCNSLTSVLTPKNISYKTLHDKLKEKGFIIYAGQGGLEEKTFRIGNMGVLTTKDVMDFISSLKSTLENMNCYPCYE